MASSIGFSDPTCMLVGAAEFPSRGRRYFPGVQRMQTVEGAGKLKRKARAPEPAAD
jgi:hypothetical protein